MSVAKNTAAKIREQHPNLTDDVRNDVTAIRATAAKLGALIRISTSSLDERTPADSDALFEVLREEVGLLEEQAGDAEERIHFTAFLVDHVIKEGVTAAAFKQYADS